MQEFEEAFYRCASLKVSPTGLRMWANIHN